MEKFLHPECKFKLQVEVDFGCHRMTKSDERPSTGWQSLPFPFSKARNMAVVTSRAYFCVAFQLECLMSGIFGYKFVY